MAITSGRLWIVCVCSSVVLLGAVYAQTTASSQLQNGTQGQTGGSTVTTDGDKIEKTTLEKGMENLFFMTRGYLEIVQPKRLYDQHWFNVTAITNGNTQTISNWQDWANYMIGFIVCIVVGLLFFLIMPIVGLCFCCCRCCGKCGGKARQMDPKRADCKRNSLAFSLAVLNTVMLAGVICIFLSNEILHNRMQDTETTGVIPTSERTMTKLLKYVSDTGAELEQKTNQAFNSTVGTIRPQLLRAGEETVDKVSKLVNATALLKQAEDLSSKANSTFLSLTRVSRSLETLVNHSRELSTRLTSIKNNVTTTCSSVPNCNSSAFQGYETDANFTQLDQLDKQTQNVSSVLNMTTYINQAKQSIDSIKANATASIQTQIDSSAGQIDSVRSSVINGIKQARGQIDNMTRFASDFQKSLNDSTSSVKTYSNYVWYGGLAVASVFLLVVVLFYFGLLWGQCGSRPGYDAPCCNKGAGANFLMAGVFFAFFLGWLLMLIVVVLFAAGGPVYTEGCRYFVNHEPAALQPFEKMLMESGVLQDLFSGRDVNFSVVNGLESCKKDQGIFTAFRLDAFINLDSLANVSRIEEEIDNLKSQNIDIPTVEFVNPELRKVIADFAAAGLDNINFSQFDAQLQRNLTQVDLKELAGQLDSLAAMAPSPHNASLKANAQELRLLDSTLVADMLREKSELANALTQLRTHTTIRNDTQALIDNLVASQENFNNNSNTLAKEALVNVTNDIKQSIGTQVNGLKDEVRNNIGRCKEVYDTFYLATDIACVSVLDPMNCLWFAMGWCLFFFIPCIILAVKLADLYRPELPYEESKHEFDDPNYSMYGTQHHDTIPLTSVNNGHRAEAGYPGIRNDGYHREGSAGKFYDNGYPAYGHDEARGYPAEPYRQADTRGNRPSYRY